MLRVVTYLLIAIVLLTLLRSIIGILAKALGAALESGTAPGSVRSGPQAGGELKRDPVCGTYVSAATSLKKTADGQTYHFCSAACRDKFRPKG